MYFYIVYITYSTSLNALFHVFDTNFDMLQRELPLYHFCACNINNLKRDHLQYNQEKLNNIDQL